MVYFSERRKLAVGLSVFVKIIKPVREEHCILIICISNVVMVFAIISVWHDVFPFYALRTCIN